METFLKLLNTAAIVTGAIVAWRGLKTWREQLKGESDYAIARRYLKAIYKVRNAIKLVRNPFISYGEFASALQKVYPGTTFDKASNKEKNFAVYSLRWEKLIEAQTELDVESLDAEVLWGKESIGILKDLQIMRAKLYTNLKMFLDGDRGNGEKIDKIIYDSGDGDEFNVELIEAIKKIENYLGKYLR